MIKFRAQSWEKDLSGYGLTLNEESNMFMDNMIKSYSFPFTMDFIDEIAKDLGLPNVDDVIGYLTNVQGHLLILDTYYEAIFRLEDHNSEYGEATIYFGDETLPIYDTDLKSLPWPVHIVNTSQQLALDHLNRPWPEVSHNFPRIYRPDIAEKSDYEFFEFFANNYSGSDFVQNQVTGSEPEYVYENHNVLIPCPYMLEMLTFGFISAGKKVRGGALLDERLKKMVYLPEDYIEKFQGSLFANFEFSLPDSQEIFENVRVGVYKRSFTPDKIGSYTIKFNINLDPVLASIYRLRIYQKDVVSLQETDLYIQDSKGNRVTVNEELSVNITSTNQFDPIHIELRIPYVTDSIAQWNGFEYRYREGRLNELIGTYSLSEYVPSMKFGEYANAIKNWLNLDIVIDGEYVTIDFVESIVQEFPEEDLSKYEIRLPKRSNNGNRVFKLIYNDKSEVIVDGSGQIFSDLDKEKEDIIEIKMEVQVAVIEQNRDIITAVFPESAKLVFSLYDGLQSGKNDCVDNVNGFYGRVDDVYRAFWREWLRTRTNNITIRDTFKVHESVRLDLRTKYYKYNKIMIPKSISRKQDGYEHWEIEMEYETI